jgi:hypothetical protein
MRCMDPYNSNGSFALFQIIKKEIHIYSQKFGNWVQGSVINISITD